MAVPKDSSKQETWDEAIPNATPEQMSEAVRQGRELFNQGRSAKPASSSVPETPAARPEHSGEPSPKVRDLMERDGMSREKAEAWAEIT
jgi:hypothetical protein